MEYDRIFKVLESGLKAKDDVAAYYLNTVEDISGRLWALLTALHNSYDSSRGRYVDDMHKRIPIEWVEQESEFIKSKEWRGPVS